MKSEHTCKREVVQLVFKAKGPGKALDAGQRLLGVKKKTLVDWFEVWQASGRKTAPRRHTQA